MGPRGVFFDLYGTLLIYGDMAAAWSDWLSALWGSLTACGLSIPKDSLAERCNGFFERPDPPPDSTGLTIFERRLRVLCAELGLDTDDGCLRKTAATSVAAWDGHVTLDPETVPMLKALKPTKSLALVSNYDHPPHVHKLLAKHRLTGFFDAIVVSGEVGVKKPDPRIFAPALEQTGLRPEQALFVGDAVEDIEGARAAGLAPILIQRAGAGQTEAASDFCVNRRGFAAQPNHQQPKGVTVIRSLSELVEHLE